MDPFFFFFFFCKMVGIVAQATAPLLEKDPSLWCVSSWNDNSHAAGFRWDNKRMVRTSYICYTSCWIVKYAPGHVKETIHGCA